MAKTPEQRLESRQMRELRKENIKLRREVAQLRKRNSRIENDFAEMVSDDEEQIEHAPAPEVRKKQTPCPKCGSKDIKTFELRGLPYYRCLSDGCGSKGRLPEKH